MDTAEFIEKAKAVHGDRYDYCDARYVRSNQKVIIKCPVHGPFEQVPSSHLQGKRCKKCSDAEKGRLRAEKAGAKFAARARSIHGERYDYSNSVYRTSMQKLEIVCPKHGPFLATPNKHLNGSGCPKCGYEAMAEKQRLSLSDFLQRALEVHGDKYDYSHVQYERAHGPVEIICPQHGSFWQSRVNHLNGQGCPQCGLEAGVEKQRMTLPEFTERAREVHGSKYSYDQTDFRSVNDKTTIFCPEHGAFLQTAAKHMGGQGCPSCANRDMDLSKFVERAKEVHDDRYEYSKSEYLGARKKILVTCPEHGDFEQVVHAHLAGGGCPLCVDAMNSKGVQRITAWLEARSIHFVREMTFDDLRSEKNEVYRLRCDFFLPEHDAIIEFDGQQHFLPNSLWGGEEGFRVLKANDEKKNKWANEKGYRMVRIRFDQIEETDEILSKQVTE